LVDLNDRTKQPDRMRTRRASDVNSKVDKRRFELVELPCVRREWQTRRAIRALVVDGDSEAMDALGEWEGGSQPEFKHVRSTMKILGEGQWNPNRTSSSSYLGLFEIRRGHGGNARLFFFTVRSVLDRTHATIVLCGSYWKTSSSHDQEDKAMRKAFDRMNEFLEAHPEWELVTDARKT
jgi:hypothetical protein